MAAPRGDYTPRSGPLAGQTFRQQPGEAPSGPYTRYQQARAQALGFSSYSEERRLSSQDIFRALEARMVDVQNIRHWEAREQIQASGLMLQPKNLDGRAMRKHYAVRFAMDEGLYDSGDDAADDIPY